MIDYEDNFWVLFNIQGSVLHWAFIYALPAAIVAVVLLYVEDYQQFFIDTGIEAIRQSFMWNSMTAVIAILLGFRTRQALGRFWEGTGLLHQMRGEWFDASSCLMTFSRDAKLAKGKVKEVNEFRQTLLRLMSLMHASALDEISASPDNKYEVLDIGGLDIDTLKFLKNCKDNGFNRVEALQHMIQVLVTHNHHSGVLTIPPPILSRIYQTLSRGLVNLLNAKKIKDTMFPLPYAQIITWLLIFHTLFTPVIMTTNVQSKIGAALLSFAPLFGMWALNFVASQLEMPFGLDDNDLPLRHFQSEMNETLLLLTHDMADHLPHTSARAVLDFHELTRFARPVGHDDQPLWRNSRMTTSESHSTAYTEPGFFLDVDQPETSPVPYKDPTTRISQLEKARRDDSSLEKKSAVPEKASEPPKPAGKTEAKSAEASKLAVAEMKQAIVPAEADERADLTIPTTNKTNFHRLLNGNSSELTFSLAESDLQRVYDEWCRKMDEQIYNLNVNTDSMHRIAAKFEDLTSAIDRMGQREIERDMEWLQSPIRTPKTPMTGYPNTSVGISEC